MDAVRFAMRCQAAKVLRGLHSSASVNKNTRVAVVRRTRNQSIPLTYEQTKKPHQIGVMKSWNSWNTSNLKDETLYTAEVTLHDQFIRMFIKGTFPEAVESEAYFLMGYAEEMLSAILRCVVKLEIQMVTSKKDVIFRYI